MDIQTVGDWTGMRAQGPGSVSHPYFRRSLKAPLLSASVSFGSSQTTSKGSNPSARRGLRFEAKVLHVFSALLGNRFTSQLPFFFQEEMGGDFKRGQRGKIILDGLVISPDRAQVGIVEVKLRHSGEAWYQTNEFYKPIVQKAFGQAVEVRTIEVVHLYDPRVRLPQEKAILGSLDEVWELRPCFHPVLIRDKNGR